MYQNITNLVFSPTHSSAEIAALVSGRLGDELGCPTQNIDFTLASGRANPVTLGQDNLLVAAFPVYAGRMPKVFADSLRACLHGNATSAVVIAVYGNRAFDDALAEAEDLLVSQGCDLIAAIAAIAQHTFASKIGAGRPDQVDRAQLNEFATLIAAKLQAGDLKRPEIPGNSPYLVPRPLPKLAPLTSDACNYCGICAHDCPVGVIDSRDEHVIASGCILCTACVKFCPQKAKSLPENFLSKIRGMLESKALTRKEPELFL